MLKQINKKTRKCFCANDCLISGLSEKKSLPDSVSMLLDRGSEEVTLPNLGHFIISFKEENLEPNCLT